MSWTDKLNLSEVECDKIRYDGVAGLVSNQGSAGIRGRERRQLAT